jgi:hypothetical protein
VWAASSVSPVIGTHSVVVVRFGEAPTMVNSVWEAAEQWGNGMGLDSRVCSMGTQN